MREKINKPDYMEEDRSKDREGTMKEEKRKNKKAVGLK